MRYAITWLLFSILILAVVGSLNWRGYRRMTAVGVPGNASVVELLPEFHNSVRYQYHVVDQKFQGQMQSWLPNPPLGRLKVGEPLVIYYDPEHPEVSVLGNPGPMLKNETISIALAAFGIPTVAVIGWALRSSRRPANQRTDASTA